MTNTGGPSRIVRLRAERGPRDSRFLDAYVDDAGDLHIDGQDLGPATSPVSSDGEYEWFQTIRRRDIARVKILLGAGSNEDILDVLERWTGRRSYDLEEMLRRSDIPVALSTWSG